MSKRKPIWLTAGAAILALALSGCGYVDESVLDSPANFSIDIHVPFTTATPLPEDVNPNEQVIIDSNGKVTVNDTSLLLSSYTRTEDTQTRYDTLSLGDTGFAVQTLQQRLQDLGYFTNGVSGIYDAATENAVKRFEQTYGIMQTGIATSAFQNKLFAAGAPIYGSEAYRTAVLSQYTTLQTGAVGSSVYALQHRLRELGYPVGEVTGVYDSATANAVRMFTSLNGLESSTVAYVATQQIIYSENAVGYSQDGVTADSDDTTLKQGSVGTLVMQIQERLMELGYLSTDANATGIYDEATSEAVKLFAEACGMTSNGSMTYPLQAILLSDQAPAYGSSYQEGTETYTLLREGSEGDDVTRLQNRLIELGYAQGAGNGVFGTETTTALRMFQRYNNLTEDGVATGQVQQALYSPLAISYSDVLRGLQAQGQPSVTPAPVVPQPSDGAHTLTLGDQTEAVGTLQTRLSQLGYPCVLTNVYDQQTSDAVRQLQSNIGVTQTGDASIWLQRYILSRAAPEAGFSIYPSTQVYDVLQVGDTGDDVTRLQQRLWQLGYLLTENVENSIGTYHDYTAYAVMDAQMAMGYPETDGVAGPEFQCFLFSSYGDYIKR